MTKQYPIESFVSHYVLNDRRYLLFWGTLIISISPLLSCLFLSCMMLSPLKELRQLIKNRQKLILAIILIIISLWFFYRKVLPEEIVPGTVALSDYVPFFWFFFIISQKPFSKLEIKSFYYAILLTIPQQFIVAFCEKFFHLTARFIIPNNRIPLLELSIGPIEKGLAVSGTFYNPNILALYCILCSSLTIAFVLNELSLFNETGERKLFKIILPAILLVLVIILTSWAGSRNGWLAFPFILFLFAVRSKKGRLVLIPVVGIILLMIILAATEFGSGTRIIKGILPNSIFERVNVYSPEREIHYKCVVQLIKEKPWEGWGIGNYKRVCSQYFPYKIAHAHSLVLQLATEIGIPGMASVILLFGYLLLSVVFDQFKGGLPDDRWLDYGLLVAVLGVLSMQFFDLALLMTYRLNFLFWICFAILYSRKSTCETPKKTDNYS